jgi:hypothetical protein
VRSGEAVTFRVQWSRIRDNGKPSTVADELQLTLRSEQRMSLDLMPQAAETSEPPAGCVVKSLSLDVGVIHYPEPHQDRRLVAVDLWLVERLPDGKGRSQPLSLRGLYHDKIPFYFDTVTEGDKTLDVFGDLQISPGAEITMTTRSRVNDPARAALIPRPAGSPAGELWPPFSSGSTTATLRVAPDEVVSVALPPVGLRGAYAAAFAARALSFRIRVRSIR